MTLAEAKKRIADLRQQVAHYALLSADTWRQRLLDAGVEVD